MTIEFYRELALPNLGDMSKFIPFIDDISDPDAKYNVIALNRVAWEKEPVAKFGSMHYPNLFDDLQTTIGIEPIIEDVLFFRFPAHTDSTRDYIHKDRLRGYPLVREYAVTMPIQNCDNINICWYEDKDPEKTELADNPVYIAVNADDVIKVHECVLDKTLLMRTSGWHNIVGMLDRPAYFLSVRFRMDFDCLTLLDGSP